MKSKIVILIVTAISLLMPARTGACPIPVFRYALEFWDADPYIVEVYYKNSLTPREQELVDRLLMVSAGGESKANIELRDLDIEGNIDELTRGYINRLKPQEFPWIVLRYPRVSGIDVVIWSGPLNAGNVDRMLGSPVRDDVARKLAGDATTVWVLLESGDSQKDRAALDLLKRELSRLEQTLVLPDPELWLDRPRGGSDVQTPVINFDLVTVSRDDPREEFFVRMLMNIEGDLGQFENEPIVFPVYGRGIAMYAIVGRGINQWNIGEAAEFLTGPCSCQAKLLNPGVDMLMAMDWDGVVNNISDMSLANPLSGMGDFSSRETEVRDLLEKATAERLGSADRQTGRAGTTDPERVVYLDIFGDTTQKNKEIPAEAERSPEAGSPSVERSASLERSAGLDRSTAMERSVSVDRSSRVDRSSYNSDSFSGSAQAKDGETVSSPDPEMSELSGPESPVGYSREKTDFLSTFALVFSGLILIVLAGGIILYWKRIK